MNPRRWQIVTVVFVFFCLVTEGLAATYIVKPDGTGDFATIQAAIDAAVNGDVIELTDGTFTGTGNRDMNLLGKAVTIRSQSDEAEQCTIDAEGAAGSPIRVFTCNSGEGPATVLQGLTLTGGFLEGGECGAALRITSNSSPTIQECRFEDNEAPCAGAAWSQGGAPTFLNCEFLNNTSAGDGGAVFLTDASAVLTGCLFVGNTAGSAGGALACNFSSAPVVTDCTFSGNNAGAGGAFWASRDATPTFLRCTFSGNSTSSSQGVIGGRENVVITLISCLVVNTTSGSAAVCLDPAVINAACTNVFGNADGDWVDCLDGQLAMNLNLSVDPEFCSTDPDAEMYWWLQSDSPLLGANQSGELRCDRIGAWPALCQTTPIEPATWGRLKSMIREP